MAGFTALVSKHLYLGVIVSCHFDIIPGFLDQVRCSWHDKSTVPSCNTQPSIKHPLPEPAATDKPAHPLHCSFCHRGAPGPRDSPANDTAALYELGTRCQGGGSWAGRCQHHGKVWALPQVVHEWTSGLFLGRWRWLSLKEQTEGGIQKCTSLSPGKVTRATWRPAQVPRTFVAFQHYSHIWAASVPAQPEDGTLVPPHPCPCWFVRPTGPLGRGEAAKWCFWQDSR